MILEDGARKGTGNLYPLKLTRESTGGIETHTNQAAAIYSFNRIFAI